MDPNSKSLQAAVSNQTRYVIGNIKDSNSGGITCWITWGLEQLHCFVRVLYACGLELLETSYLPWENTSHVWKCAVNTALCKYLLHGWPTPEWQWCPRCWANELFGLKWNSRHVVVIHLKMHWQVRPHFQHFNIFSGVTTLSNERRLNETCN